jgi:hypothetical protein
MDEVLVNYCGNTCRSRVVNVCVCVYTHKPRGDVLGWHKTCYGSERTLSESPGTRGERVGV